MVDEPGASQEAPSKLSKNDPVSRTTPNYSFFPVISTIFALCFCGGFQLGFQDIYYENYFKILYPGANRTDFYRNGAEFDLRLDATSLLFHGGATVGAVLGGILYLLFNAKISFLVGAGFIGISSALTALIVVLGPYMVLGIVRSIYGIGVGIILCVQINVLNGIALEKEKLVFNLLTAASVALGNLVALFTTGNPFTSKSIWFGGHIISALPFVISTPYIIARFKNPPVNYVFEGNDEKALASAHHYYGEFYADKALAEIQEKMKIKHEPPTLCNIWKDSVATKAFLIALISNGAAGITSQRFGFIYVFRLMSAHNFEEPLSYSLSVFLIFVMFLGIIFCGLLLQKLERKHLLITSAVIGSVIEFLFGIYWQFFSSELEAPNVVTVGATIKSIQQLFYSLGLDPITYFVILDLNFSPGNAVYSGFCLGLRMFLTTFHPYLHGLLAVYSPMAVSSVITGIIGGFVIFAVLEFPNLGKLTSYQLMKSFGHTMSFNATPDEISAVRSRLHKLWSTLDSNSKIL